MRNYIAKNVDEYIESAVDEARPILTQLRHIVTSTIPGIDEKISWGVPFYRYHGLLAGFSTFTKHVSFGLAFALSENDRAMLEKQGYKTGSKTIQIRFNQPIPVKAIEKIVREKAKTNEHDKLNKARA